MASFEGLDDPNLPKLEVSGETSALIKEGAYMANHCRKMADLSLDKAERMRGLVFRFERLALAYQQTAKEIIDEVGETVSMEWIGDEEYLNWVEPGASKNEAEEKGEPE